MEKTIGLSVKWRAAALAAALLAAVLLAAPALAQAPGRNVTVQYVDCSQVQSAIAGQDQYGFTIGDGATAELAQELGISQEQVNACLGSNGSDDRVVDDGDDGNTIAKGDVLSDTIPDKKVLAATGGIGLPGTAFLALALVGTGLSVLRFGMRRDR